MAFLKSLRGIMRDKFFNTSTYFTLATVFGLLGGYLQIPAIFTAASVVSEIFMNCLKLVSVPIIFLSIVSTAGGMESIGEIKILGKKVVKYTLLTTVISASIALMLFLLIDPVRSQVIVEGAQDAVVASQPASYWGYLLQTIPSNFVQPFSESQVISVLLLAVVLSLAILTLPEDNKKVLHSVFSSLYAAVMKITSWIVLAMPVAVWAFLTLFIKDLSNGLEIKNLALYLACVVGANLIQGFIVLPLFLKFKGLSPLKIAKGMAPALSLAFFTKSSSATVPTAVSCAVDNLSISRKVAQFIFPLCTSINMNGCAAFILTTVLFVSMSNGMTFSLAEMIAWIFIATVAAVGNAGVPMGCYFLSSAFLAAMNVPLNILGVILPFYAIIDMIETAINVWSDSCVTVVVNKEIPQESNIGSAADVDVTDALQRPSRCC